MLSRSSRLSRVRCSWLSFKYSCSRRSISLYASSFKSWPSADNPFSTSISFKSQRNTFLTILESGNVWLLRAALALIYRRSTDQRAE
jgi:hypothetical protein